MSQTDNTCDWTTTFHTPHSPPLPGVSARHCPPPCHEGGRGAQGLPAATWGASVQPCVGGGTAGFACSRQVNHRCPPSPIRGAPLQSCGSSSACTASDAMSATPCYTLRFALFPLGWPCNVWSCSQMSKLSLGELQPRARVSADSLLTLTPD